MKIRIEKGYIAVTSSRITYFCGLFNGVAKTARAAAFFPFVFFRSEEEKVPWIINHELIHFRQQLETAIIGSVILSSLETLYARLILGKSLKEAYLWRSAEQEAYRNQHDRQYLSNRPLWAQCKYLKDKRIFTLGRPGEIIYANDETPTST